MKKKDFEKRKINEIRTLLLNLIDSELQNNKMNSKNDILINSMTRDEITQKYEAYNNYKIETDYDIYSNNETENEYYSSSITFDHTSKNLVSTTKNPILNEVTNSSGKKNKSTVNCSDILLFDETDQKLSPVKATKKLIIGEKKLLKEINDEKNNIKEKNLIKLVKNGPLIKKKDTIGTINAINNALLKVEIQYQFEEVKKKKKKEIELKQKRAIRNLRYFCFTYLKLKNKNNNTIPKRKQSEDNITKISKKTKSENIKMANFAKKNKKSSTRARLTKNNVVSDRTGQVKKTKTNFSGFLKCRLDEEEKKNKKNNKKNKKDQDVPYYCEVSEKRRKKDLIPFENSFPSRTKLNKTNKISKNDKYYSNNNINSTNRKSYQNNSIHFTFELEKIQEENNENIKPKKTRCSSRYMTHKAGKNLFLKNNDKNTDSKLNKEVEKIIKSSGKKKSRIEKKDLLISANCNLNSLRSLGNNDNDSFLNYYNNSNTNKKPIKIQEWTYKTEKSKKKTKIEYPKFYTTPFEFNDEENTSVNSEIIQEKPKKKNFFQRQNKRKLTFDKRRMNN